MPTPSVERLLVENHSLRRRLEEAEDTLRALRSGEVDAVLVGAGSEQVWTLEPFTTPYRLLVEQRPHAVATLTTEGEILTCNRRFSELVHRPLEALIGSRIGEFAAPDDRGRLAALLQAGLSREVEGEVALQRDDGTIVPAYLGVNAMREGAYGTCLLVTELTEQRHYQELLLAQQALRESEQRLELAQRAGRVGWFEWDVQAGAVTWSATNERLHGLAPRSFGGRRDDWLALVHPGDRARVEARLARAVERGAELDVEYRIVRPDGNVGWIATKARVFRAADGRVLRVLGVSLDVSERKIWEARLLDADRRKDHFLATLAHELRNPLAPIRNAVAILEAQQPPQQQARWALGVLRRQIGVMARLLEDLLDVSRISRGALDLRVETVDLKDVLDAALETSRPALEAGHHHLAVEVPERALPLRADPVRLAQVFSNLLHNAAKYTQPGGNVRLAVDARGDELAVTVQDDGMGIPGDALPHIFEIFSQARPALPWAQGGLGVGLSLVKGVVDLHGGTIEAHSEGVGRGSRFVVRLPLAVEEEAERDGQAGWDGQSARDGQAAPEERAEAQGQAAGPGDEAAREVEAGTEAVHGAESSRAGTLVQGESWRVLVVDDNRDSAETLARVLAGWGHETVTAYDGGSALAQADVLRPAVLLLDLGLPGIDGYEVCSRLRATDWGRRATVVALSGWGQQADRERAQQAGFDDHLVKPVDPEHLLELLEELLARRNRGAARGAPP